MASSHDLETWSFPDSWVSEAFSRDTETLTKALQKSLYNTNVGIDGPISFPESINPLLNLIQSSNTTTPAASTFSGSEPDAVTLKRHRPDNNNTSVVEHSRKISKRKSRASKRSQTTFITADAADFRQMVQQVTGVRFGNSQVQVVKPEPNRLLQVSGGGCLPTLDTSAFLLEHHQQHQQVLSNGNGGGSMGLPHPDSFEFDAFPSFPTLDSWKVVS